MGSYVPSTREERREMLRAIGLEDYRDLYKDVPQEMYLDRPLNLPEGMSELEVSRAMKEMAGKNRVFSTVLRGAGAYDHYIPSVVKYIPAKEEFLTAYTPYQAEMSQGVLQSIFEYQTMICALTGMDVSNASVYDGATAAAEAAAMCRDRKRRVTLISAAAHPDTINTVRTYCYGTNDELRIVPAKDGRTDMDALKEMLTEDVASFYVQQPNFYGQFEEAFIYTVVGSSVAIFGGEWDLSLKANDMDFDGMVYQLHKEGVYVPAGTVEYKVVLNRHWNTCWPAENATLDIPENATYDISFTYSPDSQEVTANAVKQSQDINATGTGEKAHKVIKDGQLLIKRNGKTYNALGAEVK